MVGLFFFSFSETLDYNRTDMNLVFSSAGTQCVDIGINDDAIPEGTEEFMVILSSSAPISITNSASILIVDDPSGLCNSVNLL